MKEREALKLALEAFEAIPEEIEGWIPNKCTDAVIAIKEALANHIPDAENMVEQPEQEPVAIMREMLEVQGQHGNWNYDSYMHGLYNGMEYMVALAEKRGPQFRDAPETWLAKYEVKRNNFNITEPLTEVTPPQPKEPEQEPVAWLDPNQTIDSYALSWYQNEIYNVPLVKGKTK